MARNRIKSKGRREAGSFIAVPRAVLESPQYARLSPYGIKLMFDLYSQYRGNNNGDLCAAWSLMKPKGWKSKGTLQAAIEELRSKRWAILSRQGGRNRPSLYALSFIAIDECGGKLDIEATATPPGDWKLEINSGTRNKGQPTRHAGQSKAAAA